MSNLHKNVPLGNMHIPYNWEYADASARTGATGLEATDEGKFARQLDDNSLWMLVDYTGPTWVAVNGAAASGGVLSGVAYTTGQLIGNPAEITNAQQIVNHMYSAGVMAGCELTDNADGTVSISAGYAMLRGSTDETGPLYAIEVAAQGPISLTDDSANYIYLDYNAGAPTFQVSTTPDAFNCLDKCIAYLVHRDGNTLHYVDLTAQNVDFGRKARRLFMGFRRFIPGEGGSILSSPSGTTLAVTAGIFYHMLEALPHNAFDTSGADTFTLWYRDGAGGWTATPGESAVGTTTYDNNTGIPVDTANNKFGVSFVYLVHGDGLHVVMGQAIYDNSADAVAATAPATLPTLLTSLGSLLGLVTYEKSDSTFTDVLSTMVRAISGGSGAEDHNTIGGLQGGTTGEYYHLTAARHTALTGASDTGLHYHATDRDRTNHTGVQPLSSLAQSGATDGQVAKWDDTAGEWIPADESGGSSGDSVAAGTIILGGNTAPSGYLACDGASLAASTYADLYAAVGTTWGAAAGSGNGLPWVHQHGFNGLQSGDLGSWTTDSAALPAALFFGTALATRGTVYYVGGYYGAVEAANITDVIHTAPITSGGIGSFTSSSTYPTTIAYAAAVIIGDKLHVFGGYDSTATRLADCYYTTIGTDGALGTWTAGPPLPAPRWAHSAVVIGDSVYVIGGRNAATTAVDTIYRAAIKGDDTIGSWTAITALPHTAEWSSAVAIGDKIYLVGGTIDGNLSSAVYVATVNTSDGSIGTWSTTNALPEARNNVIAVTTDNTMYVIGGYNGTGSITSVYHAAINTDGTIGTWSTGTPLPTATRSMYNAVVTSTHLCIIGGRDASNNPLDDIMKVPFSGGADNYSGIPSSGTFNLPDYSGATIGTENAYYYIKT